MYYNEIEKHIKNKFLSVDKIKKIDKIPIDDELENINDNILYEIPLICIAVDVVDFKKMNKHTDPKILNVIMSEFTYGITRIMKHYDGQSIDIQGDGIYCILNGKTKEDMDNAFYLSCALNTFKNHLNKKIKNHNFVIKKDEISYIFQIMSNQKTLFNFGIGLWFSFKNYISKVGHRKNRELIFMGKSVNFANALAKKASRNNEDCILMNDLLKYNFTDKTKKHIENIGGFESIKWNEFNDSIWGCNWIMENYDDFIKNNF